jgi:LysR family hydrogen peroxide-inducible transcriptional activator
MELNKPQLSQVKRLKQPSPAREVSLVTHRDHIKTRIIKALREEIVQIIPRPMQKLQQKKILEITY